MNDFDIALTRLTAWLSTFGPTKGKEFAGDIAIVLLAARASLRQSEEIERLRKVAAMIECPKCGYKPEENDDGK